MQEQVVVDLAVEVDLFLHPVDRMEGVPPFASFPVELRTAVDDTFHVELIGREEEANHRTAVVGLPICGHQHSRLLHSLRPLSGNHDPRGRGTDACEPGQDSLHHQPPFPGIGNGLKGPPPAVLTRREPRCPRQQLEA